MTGFEPRTSGIWINRSTNWATTTAPYKTLFVGKQYWKDLNDRSAYVLDFLKTNQTIAIQLTACLGSPTQKMC